MNPDITIISAFIAGLLSFFAPCLVPLLPSYFSIITGFTFADLYGLEFSKIRMRVFLSSFFFAAGFVTFYSILGTTGSYFGKLLNEQLQLMLKFSGVFLIFLGLIQLEVIRFDFLNFDYAWRIQRRLTKLGYLTAFLTGLVCALIWIPCIGQILAPILFLAATSTNALQGFVYLFVFSLGLATPFLILGLFFPTIFTILQKYRFVFHYLSRLAGIILIIFGIIIVLGKYQLFIITITNLWEDLEHLGGVFLLTPREY